MARSQYKESIDKIKELARRYNRAMQDLIISGVDVNHGYLFDPSAENNPDYKFAETTSPEVFANQRFVLGINYALSVLPDTYRLLVWSDYFKRDARDWWYAYYSKSSYYRLRKMAVEAFIDLIK